MRSDMLTVVTSTGKKVKGWAIPLHHQGPAEGLVEYLNTSLPADSWDGDECGVTITLDDGVLEEETVYHPGDFLVPGPWVKVQKDRKTWPKRVATDQWRLADDE